MNCPGRTILYTKHGCSDGQQLKATYIEIQIPVIRIMILCPYFLDQKPGRIFAGKEEQ
jgi:hypothetical protein